MIWGGEEILAFVIMGRWPYDIENKINFFVKVWFYFNPDYSEKEN